MVTGTHFSTAEHGGGAAQGDDDRARDRRQDRVRHRLPAEPVGPRRARRRRIALHRLRPGVAASAADPARLRPDRRHRGRGQDRRRRGRCADGPAQHPRRAAAPPSC